MARHEQVYRVAYRLTDGTLTGEQTVVACGKVEARKAYAAARRLQSITYVQVITGGAK